MIEKEYPIQIDTKILELLGPSLYSNIYYVLAELIANAYDADAHNVWVDVSEDLISVEDDGSGMSYNDPSGIKKYLNVAEETRKTDSEAYTPIFNRPKMGRKGIGKLAALAVSERVNIMTVKDNDKSGFVLAREVHNKLLDPIPENQIRFLHMVNVPKHGTRVEMPDPAYKLPHSVKDIEKNLVNFFPQIGQDFKIHISKGSQSITVENYSVIIAKQLDTLSVFGDGFEELIDNFPKDGIISCEENKPYEQTIDMFDSNNKKIRVNQTIKGWIGTYKSTTGHKKNQTDFPNNFLAIYSHGKLGEFNILESVGTNRVTDVYLVGQLFIDSFEETNLPDMALSNRQGYKTDDIRYQKMIEWTKGRVKYQLAIKDKVIKSRKGERERIKVKKAADEQKKLNGKILDSVNAVKDIVSKSNSQSASEFVSKLDAEQTKKLSNAFESLGTKAIRARENSKYQKEVFISQNGEDEILNNCIYRMLIFNGFQKNEIIYSNSGEEESDIPGGLDIYEYLKYFFVQNMLKNDLYVFYVITDNSARAHGVAMEMGAGWVTGTDHAIVKGGKCDPQKPLNIEKKYAEIRLVNQTHLYCTKQGFLDFYEEISLVCKRFGKEGKDQNSNEKYFVTSFGEILSKADFNQRISQSGEHTSDATTTKINLSASQN